MMKAVPKEVIEPMIERIPLRRLGPVSYKHLDVYKRQGINNAGSRN